MITNNMVEILLCLLVVMLVVLNLETRRLWRRSVADHANAVRLAEEFAALSERNLRNFEAAVSMAKDLAAQVQRLTHGPTP